MSFTTKVISGLYLLLIWLFVFHIRVASAQWTKVDGDMVWCYAEDDTYIYAGHIGGVYIPWDTAAPRSVIRSSDSGATWTSVSKGLLSGTIYSLNVFSLAVIGDKLLAGTDKGIFLSSDHGDNWTQLNFDPSNGEVHCLFADDSIIFAGVDAGELRCEDGGVFSSTDQGASWLPANSGLTNHCGDKRVYAFAKIGSTLFAGSWLGGVFYSTNNGGNWTKTSHATDGWQVTSFAVIDSNLFAGLSGALFCSTDRGVSWTRCESGLTDSVTHSGYAIQALVSSGRNLFAGTDLHGVYLSTNLGESWSSANSNLGTDDILSANVYSLAVLRGYVFAGTGSGIWRRLLSEITHVKKDTAAFPKNFELEQNYPNPFNPSTAIGYQLSAVSRVSLKIYDILGREVKTLVNEVQSPGNHLISLDTTNLPSGVYFYRLRVNGRTATKKMVLIR